MCSIQVPSNSYDYFLAHEIQSRGHHYMQLVHLTMSGNWVMRELKDGTNGAAIFFSSKKEGFEVSRDEIALQI